ncbi:Membrane progestin receptor alpha-B, partial [Ophiophagus hannah]
MATIVSEKLSHLFINLQHLCKIPQLLSKALPAPSCTVAASEVPQLFRKPYIHAGYRPLHRSWTFYFLSLFQQHNEALNVWTHLLAAFMLLGRFWQLSQIVDFVGDPHAQPFCIVAVSSIIYSTFSTLAHLLQAKSEFCHYTFFFLDYVGVATYQYSSALVHYYYAIEPEWHAWISSFYILGAVGLAWLSCAGSCYAKYRCPHLSPLQGRLCQEMPSAVAYALDISPVLHRIYTSTISGKNDLAATYHKCHVLCFLVAAFFFAYPYPEKWFPGKCHFVGQGHQLFHMFLILCTFIQLEAVLIDYRTRRHIYADLHGDLAPFFSIMCLVLMACCSLTALYMMVKHLCTMQSQTPQFCALRQGTRAALVPSRIAFCNIQTKASFLVLGNHPGLLLVYHEPSLGETCQVDVPSEEHLSIQNFVCGNDITCDICKCSGKLVWRGEPGTTLDLCGSK